MENCMNKSLIIDKTREYVKSRLEGEASGHDWWHIVRVCNTAEYIAEKEHADIFVVQLAALLHDIADWKFNGGSVDVGADMAGKWLESLQVPQDIVNKVKKIVRTISFKGGTADSRQDTIEGKAVQDADRLDAIGAIGIARTFAYGGFKGREMYNPEVKPKTYKDFEEYKKSTGTTINHFYEKLLLLKDLMNTETGKAIAEERHAFMEMYLNQFFREWDCKDL